VAQFLEQYYTRADLQEFFGLFLQSALGDEPTTVGPNDFGAGVEVSRFFFRTIFFFFSAPQFPISHATRIYYFFFLRSAGPTIVGPIDLGAGVEVSGFFFSDFFSACPSSTISHAASFFF
jgi:hypothetical protein